MRERWSEQWGGKKMREMKREMRRDTEYLNIIAGSDGVSYNSHKR